MRSTTTIMLDSLFVAAVLEGFEGTLDEVIQRIDGLELRTNLDALQSQIAALRISIDDGAAAVSASFSSRGVAGSDLTYHWAFQSQGDNYEP